MSAAVLSSVEAGLRVMKDPFAELDDLVSIAINRFTNRALQFVLARHDALVPTSIR